PARAELTFRLVRDEVDSVLVPRGTQVAAADAGGPPLVFETDGALIALGARLKAVQSFDGFGYSVETTRNKPAGQGFYPFGTHARAAPCCSASTHRLPSRGSRSTWRSTSRTSRARRPPRAAVTWT